MPLPEEAMRSGRLMCAEECACQSLQAYALLMERWWHQRDAINEINPIYQQEDVLHATIQELMRSDTHVDGSKHALNRILAGCSASIGDFAKQHSQLQGHWTELPQRSMPTAAMLAALSVRGNNTPWAPAVVSFLKQADAEFMIRAVERSPFWQGFPIMPRHDGSDADHVFVKPKSLSIEITNLAVAVLNGNERLTFRLKNLPEFSQSHQYSNYWVDSSTTENGPDRDRVITDDDQASRWKPILCNSNQGREEEAEEQRGYIPWRWLFEDMVDDDDEAAQRRRRVIKAGKQPVHEHRGMFLGENWNHPAREHQTPQSEPIRVNIADPDDANHAGNLPSEASPGYSEKHDHALDNRNAPKMNVDTEIAKLTDIAFDLQLQLGSLKSSAIHIHKKFCHHRELHKRVMDNLLRNKSNVQAGLESTSLNFSNEIQRIQQTLDSHTDKISCDTRTLNTVRKEHEDIKAILESTIIKLTAEHLEKQLELWKVKREAVQFRQRLQPLQDTYKRKIADITEGSRELQEQVESDVRKLMFILKDLHETMYPALYQLDDYACDLGDDEDAPMSETVADSVRDSVEHEGPSMKRKALDLEDGCVMKRARDGSGFVL